MPFFSCQVIDADGNKVAAKVSQMSTLLKFDDQTFAVREGHYRAKAGPYLHFGACKRYTVPTIGSINKDGNFEESLTADFRLFRKNGNLKLPNTCIESAEHVLKCVHANRHSVDCIANDSGARVSMSIGTHGGDIDRDDMGEVAFAAFPHGVNAVADAAREGFEPGDGMALVYSGDPKRRKKGEWTVHAVAILLKSTHLWDPFVVVSEVFAPDDGEDVQMTDDWVLSCYRYPQDFKDRYFECMKPDKYTLWKLSAAVRS
jgi:hypothetical protein